MNEILFALAVIFAVIGIPTLIVAVIVLMNASRCSEDEGTQDE